MQTYRVETTILRDGMLIIKGLPFQAGDKVEVVVRAHRDKRKRNGRYPLRGKPIRYADPFESVAERDWDALR